MAAQSEPHLAEQLAAYLDDMSVALMAVTLVALWECVKVYRLVDQSDEL